MSEFKRTIVTLLVTIDKDVTHLSKEQVLAFIKENLGAMTAPCVTVIKEVVQVNPLK